MFKKASGGAAELSPALEADAEVGVPVLLAPAGIGRRSIRFSLSLLPVEEDGLSSSSRESNKLRKVCSRWNSIMLTGVKVEEVGEALMADEADMLEVGDMVPASAFDITLESADLFRICVGDAHISVTCRPAFGIFMTHNVDSASLFVAFFTLPGRAEKIFACERKYAVWFLRSADVWKAAHV